MYLFLTSTFPDSLVSCSLVFSLELAVIVSVTFTSSPAKSYVLVTLTTDGYKKWFNDSLSRVKWILHVHINISIVRILNRQTNTFDWTASFYY